MPFVEDTVVPPENLADYIAEFRAVLDRRGLVYGMFGHVDAGVPARAAGHRHEGPGAGEADPRGLRRGRRADAQVQGRAVGRAWQGRAFRVLAGVLRTALSRLQEIKAAFDPHNQLNPGKIAAPRTPAAEDRRRADPWPARPTDPVAVRLGYDEALHCNGNAACFNYDPDDAMCPSWKATRERRHSPKGRASLMREWLRRLAARASTGRRERRLRARPWLAWPAGAPANSWREAAARRLLPRGEGSDGRMPRLQVVRRPVPDQGRRAGVPREVPRTLLRPLSASAADRLVCLARTLYRCMARMPRLDNALVGSSLGRAALRRLGLVESPRLSGVEPAARAARRGCRGSDACGAAQPSAEERPAASSSCRTPSQAITRHRSSST